MHPSAYEFVATQVRKLGPFRRVVDFGGADINGTARPLFADAEYLSIDEHAAPGVDLVADAAGWDGEGAWDCVVCTEVLEHAADAAAIVRSAHRALCPGGVFIVTAAGDGRPRHHNWSEDEPYCNVSEEALGAWLGLFARFSIEHNRVFRDIYAVAFK